MRSLGVLLLLALMPLIASCGIHSEEPLGVVKPLKSEEWNGQWLVVGDTEPSVVQVEVIDAEKAIVSGRVLCNPADAKGADGLLLMRSAEGGWYFPVELERDVQGRPKAKGPPFEYMYFHLRPSASLWFAYVVNRDRIKALVEQGALPGRIEGSSPSPLLPGAVEDDITKALRTDVILGHLEPEHYKVLLSEERPVVFWKWPMVLVKLPPSLDPCPKGA